MGADLDGVGGQGVERARFRLPPPPPVPRFYPRVGAWRRRRRAYLPPRGGDGRQARGGQRRAPSLVTGEAGGTAPPSVGFADISPTRGEISSFGVAAILMAATAAEAGWSSADGDVGKLPCCGWARSGRKADCLAFRATNGRQARGGGPPAPPPPVAPPVLRGGGVVEEGLTALTLPGFSFWSALLQLVEIRGVRCCEKNQCNPSENYATPDSSGGSYSSYKFSQRLRRRRYLSKNSSRSFPSRVISAIEYECPRITSRIRSSAGG